MIFIKFLWCRYFKLDRRVDYRLRLHKLRFHFVSLLTVENLDLVQTREGSPPVLPVEACVH